jgi:hypothetical protein
VSVLMVLIGNVLPAVFLKLGQMRVRAGIQLQPKPDPYVTWLCANSPTHFRMTLGISA